jgi:hypothetical protein
MKMYIILFSPACKKSFVPTNVDILLSNALFKGAAAAAASGIESEQILSLNASVTSSLPLLSLCSRESCKID